MHIETKHTRPQVAGPTVLDHHHHYYCCCCCYYYCYY
jgi:hypothetical protein